MDTYTSYVHTGEPVYTMALETSTETRTQSNEFDGTHGWRKKAETLFFSPLAFFLSFRGLCGR